MKFNIRMNEMQKSGDIMYKNELHIFILLQRTLSCRDNDVTTMFPPCYILAHYTYTQELCKVRRKYL